MLPDKHNRAVGDCIAHMSNERDQGELVRRSNREGTDRSHSTSREKVATRQHLPELLVKEKDLPWLGDCGLGWLCVALSGVWVGNLSSEL